MKKIIYITAIFLFAILFHEIGYAQGSWERITSPTNKNLNSISFVDSLYGWAVGDSGVIIHSSNGGNEWSEQTSNTMDRIVDVFFLDINMGWAISWYFSSTSFGTVVLSTTDGGLNWSGEPYREENIFMNSLLFFDSMNGWMVGDPHSILKTTDGGDNWNQAEVDTTDIAFLPVMNIAFYNEQYGYACGGHFDFVGITWRTSNGGDKWYSIKPEDAPAEPVRALHIIDSLNVIGVSGGFEPIFPIDIIRTSDGGVSWEYETLPFNGEPFDLDFRSETEVWVPIATFGTFLVSTDAGVNWEQTTTPDTTAIYDVVFADSMHGFAVGEQGVILKYKPPIVSSISLGGSIINDNYNLYQNFPNPFNPTTKIQFNLVEPGRVKLTVFNVLGQEISILLDRMMSGGLHTISFEATGLKSGIYFYKIEVKRNNGNRYSSVNKMILLR